MRRLILALTLGLVTMIGTTASASALTIPPTATGSQSVSIAWGDLQYFVERGGYVSCQILKRDAVAAKANLASRKATIFAGGSTTWGPYYTYIKVIRSKWTSFVGSYTALYNAGVACPTSKAIRTTLALRAIGATSTFKGGYQTLGIMFPSAYAKLTAAQIDSYFLAGSNFDRAVLARDATAMAALRAPAMPGSWTLPLSIVAWRTVHSETPLNEFTGSVAYNRAWVAGDRTWATSFLNLHAPQR